MLVTIQDGSEKDIQLDDLILIDPAYSNELCRYRVRVVDVSEDKPGVLFTDETINYIDGSVITGVWRAI